MGSSQQKLRALEGLGYVAAAMIGVGGVMDNEAVRYFNIFGLVFAIIIIVRLLVMNISLGLLQQLYEPPPDHPDSDAEGPED